MDIIAACREVGTYRWSRRLSRKLAGSVQQKPASSWLTWPRQYGVISRTDGAPGQLSVLPGASCACPWTDGRVEVQVEPSNEARVVAVTLIEPARHD
jgi:hypothetical protein